MNIVQRRINYILLLAMLFSTFMVGCSKSQVDTQAGINAQKVVDDGLITKYLTANNLKAGEVDSSEVATGIYYTVDSLGTDSTLYTSSTLVTVGYTCWQLKTDGTKSAAVQETNSFNPSFTLGSVIDGWQLAFEDIQIGKMPGPGGAITLYIPSAYAYGPYPQATLGLPANAVLIFHINIYNVQN